MHLANEILILLIGILLGRTMAVVIHELGHIIAYTMEGIPIRAIFILGFAFIHNENWNIHLCITNMTLTGGFVIPDFPIIDSRDKFCKIKQKHMKAVMAGVLLSAFCIIGILALLYFIRNIFIKYILYSFCVYSILIVLYAVKEDEAGKGDIAVLREYRKSDLYAAIEIYESLIYTSNAIEKIRKSEFLHDFIIQFVRSTKWTLNDRLLTEYLDYELLLQLAEIRQTKLEPAMCLYVNKIENNPYIILEQCNRNGKYMLLSHIVLYLFENNKMEEATKMYHLIASYEQETNEVSDYYNQQMQYKLKLQLSSEFLCQRDNIKTSVDYKVSRLFPIYYEIEEKINQVKIVI